MKQTGGVLLRPFTNWAIEIKKGKRGFLNEIIFIAWKKMHDNYEKQIGTKKVPDIFFHYFLEEKDSDLF